ncbi:MAG: formate dehydrogenase accessory sulfurtransferase FdhD [Robiginitalea sp.]
MATRNYEGKKFDLDGTSLVLDALTIEEALQVRINGTPFTVSMRTPGADTELVRGILHSEDIVNSTRFHPRVIPAKENEAGVVSVVDLEIPESYLGSGYSNSRSLLSVSSCGICGKTELGEDAFKGEAIRASAGFSAGQFTEMFTAMNRGQHDFKQSGGTHAAAVFDAEGSLLAIREDIGRHNAVDKVIGWLLLEEKLDKARAMTVSGRISYEITIKAFKAGIPFLAAVSAPSSLAVDYAKEFGITLMGFCREGRATCYAHPYRIDNRRSRSLKPKVR